MHLLGSTSTNIPEKNIVNMPKEHTYTHIALNALLFTYIVFYPVVTGFFLENTLQLYL